MQIELTELTKIRIEITKLTKNFQILFNLNQKFNRINRKTKNFGKFFETELPKNRT